jgi:LDH2 family malate/lactate/ureidoglycolate dehydrogenase
MSMAIPTSDAAAKQGAIAPFGGAEGYGLGVAFEVLVASLAASAIGLWHDLQTLAASSRPTRALS